MHAPAVKVRACPRQIVVANCSRRGVAAVWKLGIGPLNALLLAATSEMTAEDAQFGSAPVNRFPRSRRNAMSDDVVAEESVPVNELPLRSMTVSGVADAHEGADPEQRLSLRSKL